MSLAPGVRLGPYEIVAPIGAGGMGEVYRARDTRLERDVALKILPDEVSADPERRARFEREAKAVAALSHPEHPRDPRRRRPRRHGLRGHGAARRRDAARSPFGWGAAGPEGGGDRRADCPRPGRRSREGHRPPRREARERVHHHGRPGEGARLRPGTPGAAGRRRHALADADSGDGPGHRARDRGVHVSRAGERPCHRRTLGHLLVRSRALRDAHRPARLQAGHRGRDHDRDPQGGPAGAAERERRAARRPRAHRAPLPGEAAG